MIEYGKIYKIPGVLHINRTAAVIVDLPVPVLQVLFISGRLPDRLQVGIP